jgi:outer membrane protein, heavy metal efflux system
MFPFSMRAALWVAASFPAVCAAAPLTLEQALQLATERSQSARAARAGAVGATQAARAAGQLPDPVLGLSVENVPATGPDRFTTARESMTMKRIAISQEWVSPRKRELRSAAATAMIAREMASIAAANADTRVQTALAYIDAYYAAEALKLAVQNEGHAREAMEGARSRLAAGAGNAPDTLGLVSAQGMAEDDAADARQQFTSAKISLSRWTGREADELSAPDLERPTEQQAFVDSYPAVVAKKREIEVAKQEAAVAASNRQPNWSWQVAYGQRTGFSDLVSVGVNIPLTVAPAARQDRDTAAKLALVDKAEDELAEATRAAEAEYLQLAIEEQHHVHRIDLYRLRVLAPAAQRTAAATAAYRSNQSSLAMLFEARHAELEAQRKLLGMQRELARMRAQLMFKPLRAEELQ